MAGKKTGKRILTALIVILVLILSPHPDTGIGNIRPPL